MAHGRIELQRPNGSKETVPPAVRQADGQDWRIHEMQLAALKSIEICAGGGGSALGVAEAGFQHAALIELDGHSCATLRLNRPEWNVRQLDLREFSGFEFEGIDLLSGGVPCPPFSRAGHQLGGNDERDLFPEALRLIAESRPRAVMLENVPGLMEARFADYREEITKRLTELGYLAQWQVLNASGFGVPQLRPRVVCVALPPHLSWRFTWPPLSTTVVTVGDALRGEMSKDGWVGADAWADRANRIAPTLVGGSKRHGGPDLGPTRARAAWAMLGVDGRGLADAPPPPEFRGMPRLTVAMAARLQGFPATWRFAGGKTAAYRQIGNAFPRPVARAVASAIRQALLADDLVHVLRDSRQVAHAPTRI